MLDMFGNILVNVCLPFVVFRAASLSLSNAVLLYQLAQGNTFWYETATQQEMLCLCFVLLLLRYFVGLFELKKARLEIWSRSVQSSAHELRSEPNSYMLGWCKSSIVHLNHWWQGQTKGKCCCMLCIAYVWHLQESLRKSVRFRSCFDLKWIKSNLMIFVTCYYLKRKSHTPKNAACMSNCHVVKCGLSPFLEQNDNWLFVFA